MFKPAIQKTSVLISLASLNLILFIWASSSTGKLNAPGYDIKIEAASLMKSSMDTLKSSYYGDKPIFLDAINDYKN